MLNHSNDFSPAASIAIAPQTFRPARGIPKVDSLRFSTKEGNPEIEAGFLVSKYASSLDELKEDPNLSFAPLFLWDGRQMWSSTNLFEDEVMFHIMIRDIFSQTFGKNGVNTPNLRLLDVSYEGWYALG